jgi:lipoprotein-anchoring transpeptidase ErfK/SrfK
MGRSFRLVKLFVAAACVFAAYITVQAAPASAEDSKPEVARIIINLAEQRIYALNFDGYVVLEYPVSTGKAGYGTPTGSYKVYTKSIAAYSKKYSATMTHWMAITGDGSYGMHGLLGRSYYKLIGRPASHGCIRLRREDASELYQYVKIGTPVDIVRIEKLELPRAEQGIGQQALDRQLISDTLEQLYGDQSL